MEYCHQRPENCRGDEEHGVNQRACAIVVSDEPEAHSTDNAKCERKQSSDSAIGRATNREPGVSVGWGYQGQDAGLLGMTGFGPGTDGMRRLVPPTR